MNDVMLNHNETAQRVSVVRSRSWITLLLIAVWMPALAAAQAESADKDKDGVKMLATGVAATTRHSEKLEVPKGAQAKVDLYVELGSWRLSSATREIRVPPQGFYIADLRNGTVLTVIGGQEKRRDTGELWAVQPGESMIVKIIDPKQQNALLHILLIRSAE